MNKTDVLSLLTGQILEDDIELTLAELCRASELPTEQVIEFVEYGVIEPEGTEPHRWRFRGVSLRRIYRARRLQKDLGVNTAGVALALDLLEEMEQLRARLRRLEK